MWTEIIDKNRLFVVSILFSYIYYLILFSFFLAASLEIEIKQNVTTKSQKHCKYICIRIDAYPVIYFAYKQLCVLIKFGV